MINTNLVRVGRALYNFIWDEFCDWYIEMSKIPMNGEDESQKQTTRSVLSYVLDKIMKMLHPFMPFVTETIWQKSSTSWRNNCKS